jgi:hypothetical protein
VLVVGVLGGGPKRFNELRRALGSISQRMLTLTLLERDGLVTRTVFPSIPPRVDYALTKLGHSLLGHPHPGRSEISPGAGPFRWNASSVGLLQSIAKNRRPSFSPWDIIGDTAANVRWPMPMGPLSLSCLKNLFSARAKTFAISGTPWRGA